MSKAHSFHIPVMGIGFTTETPLKVSQYGIDSVISLVDDLLLENLRKFYCEKFKLNYNEISEKASDSRAKRITSYLNLVNDLAEKKFEQFKNTAIEKTNDLKEYINLFPDSSSIKKDFRELMTKLPGVNELREWIKENLSMGSIDVNIMTKLDKENYNKNELLPTEFNDAHAALRGFANSDLNSTIVFSAGMNPRLYSYAEQFEDFYPNQQGEIKKRIALKVSDYRSAMIQGKVFAKKGLWVSEYRIESGLNCGGHAFATEGYLMGPILEEFKENREFLQKSTFEILVQSLKEKNKEIPNQLLPIKLTAQGGVGTSEEHDFLIEHYKVDSVGWGSPFLLVDEATVVDEGTRELLTNAEEEDLFLSGVSPLGVKFNSLRNSSMEVEKYQRLKEGDPGSKCPRRFLVSNTEYTERRICTASKQYQRKKFKELEEKQLSDSENKAEYDKIAAKECICVGLAASSYLANEMESKVNNKVSVCPGPNLAYFNKRMSLKNMIDHIYGRTNMLAKKERPHMFIKELGLYLEHLKEKVDEARSSMTKKQEKNLQAFAKNLKDGISYYQQLFSNLKDRFVDSRKNIINDLEKGTVELLELKKEIEAPKINA